MQEPDVTPSPGEPSTGRPPVIFQASVLPIRRNEEGDAVCLVTSLKKKRWIFPKGIIAPGESPESSALKEAFEEAGLLGRIVGAPLGSYSEEKWGTAIEVTVYLMEVDRQEHHWAESHRRKRLFAPLSVAEGLIKKPILKEMVQRAVQRMEAE